MVVGAEAGWGPSRKGRGAGFWPQFLRKFNCPGVRQTIVFELGQSLSRVCHSGDGAKAQVAIRCERCGGDLAGPF